MTDGRRAVLAAVAVNLVSVLPLFLTGAMAVQIGRTFAIQPTSIAVMASIFALTSMLGSAPLGGRVGRWGVRRSLTIAAGTAAATLIIAGLSPSTWVLGAALAIAGASNALGQPAANALIAAHVPPRRFGLGYGIKQSGIPLATTLGGLAVPLVALSIGWRAAFFIAAALALATITLIPTDATATTGRTEGAVPAGTARPLWLLGLGLAGVVVAATSIGAFGTVGGVAVGLSEGTAGYLVAVGGFAGLFIRLGAGAYADRRWFDSLRGVAILAALGAVGWLAMATGGRWAFCAGLVVANAFGWGWPGLQQLTIARRFPTSTAAASGIAQTGVALGLLLGPISIGTIASTGGWSWAWAAAASTALIGAGVAWWLAGVLPTDHPPQRATARRTP